MRRIVSPFVVLLLCAPLLVLSPSGVYAATCVFQGISYSSSIVGQGEIIGTAGPWIVTA
jgi:hypothetical protein